MNPVRGGAHCSACDPAEGDATAFSFLFPFVENFLLPIFLVKWIPPYRVKKRTHCQTHVENTVSVLALIVDSEIGQEEESKKKKRPAT